MLIYMRLTLLVLFLGSASAYAIPITWNFQGTVAILGGGTFWTDAGVSFGDTVSGTVTWEPTAPTFFNAQPTLCSFCTPITPGIVSFSDVMVGGFAYNPNYADSRGRQRTGLNTNFISNQVNPDPFDTFALDEFDFSDFNNLRFQIFRLIAQPPGNGVIPLNEFPLVLPDFQDLLIAWYFATEFDEYGVRSDMLASFDAISVPEPGTLLLLLTGIGLIVRFRATPRSHQETLSEPPRKGLA